MKILVVTPYALPHVGGLETIIDLEIRHLRAQGHDVAVITSNIGDRGTICPDREHFYGAEIIRLPVWNQLEERIGARWPIFKPSLLKTLWRWTKWADAVHVHGHMFMTSPFAFITAKLLRKRTVMSMHGMGVWCPSSRMRFVQNILLHTVGRFSFLMADAITLQNPVHAPRLQKLGARHDAICILPNPLEHSIFYPPTAEQRAQARAALGWLDDGKKVLFIGKITAAKGCDLLLEATDESYDIIFCGDSAGAMQDKLRGGSVTCLPTRPRQEMLQLYHAADVLALPSRAEAGQPMVVCEALLAGLPAIVGRYEGAEMLAGFKHVFLTDLTAPALKGTIKQVLFENTASQDANKIEAKQALPSEEGWVRTMLSLLAAS